MNENDFVFDLSEITPEETPQVQPEVTTDAPANPEEATLSDGGEGAEGIEAQTRQMEELLARIEELETSQSQQVPPQAIQALQDRNTLLELAKDYDTMSVLDVLKEDFIEKNQKVLSANPNLDPEVAFRKYLQKNYNEEIEPLIDENFGLDDYDFAVLKSQVDEIREAKVQKQTDLKSSLSLISPSNIETDSTGNQSNPVNAEAEFQEAMKAYEQKLNSYVETGLQNLNSGSAPNQIYDGISIPVIGGDVLKTMINTLSAEQLPLIVAEDNNVYPNLPLLKELAEYRELQKNLPQFLAAYKERVVAEAFDNVKKGISNKSDTTQAPSNPYTGDIISPLNIGDNMITGFKF